MAEVMNDTVEVTQPVSVQDDAAQEQATNALEEFMAESDEGENEEQGTEKTETQVSEEPETQPEPQAQAQTNNDLPKGIRGRIQAAEAKADRSGYERGKRETEAQYQAKIADYEQRLSKYSELEVTQEAQELARKEHISLEFAKRVIRAEKGIGRAETVQQPQPAAKPQSAKFDEALLKAQYDNLKSAYGIDMFAEGVMKQEEIEAVTQGKSDFNAVALRILSERGKQTQQTQTQQTPPAPVKSTGTQHKPAYDFMSMTDEEFDRFNGKIGKGRIYKPR